MSAICFYFQVHQPYRLRHYTFFDIGANSWYEDENANCGILLKVARKCYLPMNALLLKLIRRHEGQFKVSFSISGTALDQFETYAPEVIQSYRELVATGCVELLSETYNHSLAFLYSPDEFREQVRLHDDRIEELFGVRPTSFRNTELIYNNALARTVEEMGYKAILAEGADHVLGWRSPNFVYRPSGCDSLRLLLKNYRLSDDIAFRFSNHEWPEFPLTAEKFASWAQASGAAGDIINLFMDYETFGEHQKEGSGIFDFMRFLPEILLRDGSFEFTTPTQAARRHKPIAEIEVQDPISWADEERDVTAWLGNELQQDAYNKLYGQAEKLALLNDPVLWEDYGHLQESDHFYYMSTKFFSDGEVHSYFNPYSTPYEAFINYMNVLSDFIIRIDDAMTTSGKKMKPAAEPVKAPAKGKAARKVVKDASAGSTVADAPAPAKRKPARKTTKQVKKK